MTRPTTAFIAGATVTGILAATHAPILAWVIVAIVATYALAHAEDRLTATMRGHDRPRG